MDGRQWLVCVHDERHGEEQELAECPAEIVPLKVSKKEESLGQTGLGMQSEGKLKQGGASQVRAAPPKYKGEIDIDDALSIQDTSTILNSIPDIYTTEKVLTVNGTHHINGIPRIPQCDWNCIKPASLPNSGGHQQCNTECPPSLHNRP